MMNWAKQQLANVAGTQEPIYGPSAIQPVAEQTKTTPYTELTRKDFTWTRMDSTNVETQNFYVLTDSGHVVLAQIIYSNVAGIRITSHFNTEVIYPQSANKPNLWSSDTLSNIDFNDDKTNFYADDCAIELSDDGNSYTIKSATNKKSIVNMTMMKVAPAWHAGKDGKTLIGTESKQPWGLIRHAFWPRCRAEGTIVTDDGTINLKGKGLFIMCLQGMKPHHAAAKWTFVNFQGPTHSAIMMEFITPPSYGSTVVNVGCVADDNQILCAGTSNNVIHSRIKGDPETDWPEPEALKMTWSGETKDGKSVEAAMDESLGERLNRVDVMAEVPGFVKNIVAAAVGTKPYVYQYGPDAVSLILKVGDEEMVEKGRLFSEATFIS